MRAIGVAKEGIELMLPRASGIMVSVENLNHAEASILKQESLAMGGDAALPATAYSMKGGECRVLLMGNMAQLNNIADRLSLHAGTLAALGSSISDTLSNYERAITTGLAPPPALGPAPWQVMGILNVTPDSFYDGGRYNGTEAAVAQARRMAGEGAGIIDIGGESTRPGAARISEKEELARVLPVIDAIREAGLEVPISIDTSRARVAREALRAGAAMINDVTGLAGDRRMAEVAADSGCPVCIMHMRGTPANMQRDPQYRDVVAELVEFFYQRMAQAERQGIVRENIIVDPGIGFGKNLQHNLQLLRHLDSFLSLGTPLLVGVSRKSFIGMGTGDEAGDRLPGTIAANVHAYSRGARMFRVHDVAANRQALQLAAAIEEGS